MSVGAMVHEVSQVTKSKDCIIVKSKCVLGLAKSQKFNGKAAFSVKSHDNFQALLLLPYTLCARVCARAYCAVSEMETIDTTSTSVICIVYTSSIM